MKKLSLSLFILLIASNAIAQINSAIVYGVVKDAKDNTALSFANVYLKGTMYGAQTDALGKFEIKNIPVGEYTIECSSVGFERQIFTAIKLTVAEKKVINVKIISNSV
jgi:iron complex outermembrane receptor protein